MKLEQKAKFQPITITLETEEDAELFWDLIQWGGSKRPARLKEFATKISGWFVGSSEYGNEIQELRALLDPRRWTKETSDKWHRALPDLIAAFRAIRSA